MASTSSSPLQSVTFPVSESPQKKQGSPLKPPHLPFRRISLPTAPSLLHRVSVVSVASFDSLPEDADGSPQSPRSGMKSFSGKGAKGRPISSESPRRRNRTRDASVKPFDDRLALKRRKVVREFHETEQAYVDGLELIYSHFLTPIITSLDTPEPLLNRSALTSIFSNFIDIWNLHRSFLSSLTSLLASAGLPSTPSTSSQTHSDLSTPPPISPLLLSHFPYLSLYTPFVTAFPSTISALNDLIIPPTAARPSPLYNAHFAEFLKTQEADPRCGKLKLRDWLLTIVQRCPRYLLLLKDLVNCTEKDDPEHAQLTAVHTLVAKITLSLNTSLHTHAQTLSLLALQRATPNLPFQLISPGRTLLKRGSLLQVERSAAPVEREFLLFSDCIIWLAAVESSAASWDWDWSWSGSGSNASQSTQNTPLAESKISSNERPPMLRSRSKSEAELSMLTSETGPESPPVTPQRPERRKSQYHIPPPPPPNMVKRHGSADDKWVFKGRVELVDLDVVVGTALEDERMFEVLSPEGSFVLYAASDVERDEWTSEIRAAKTQLLVSLNVTNPNSTLTSSASTNHVRRSLQALPFPPSDDRLATVRASSSLDVVGSSISPIVKAKTKKKDKDRRGVSVERRRKVDHWVPAIWIPDGKTNSCMRCGRTFGWRRRRHHCRLCGRCVCAGCSGRTFFISDSNDKDDTSTKAARACDACYDTVFPVIDPSHLEDQIENTTTTVNGGSETTTSSLSHLPAWLSMPQLPVQRQPHALMAIDLNYSPDMSLNNIDLNHLVLDGQERELEPEQGRNGRMRMKSHQRLRSYQDILEDFQEQSRVMKQQQQEQRSHSPDKSRIAKDDTFDGDGDEDEENGDVFEEEDLNHDDQWFTPTHSLVSSPVSSPRKQRREDTARRSKRFSLPAVGLHTTSVTARTTEIAGGAGDAVPAGGGEAVVGDSPGGVGGGRVRRFSLVLAGRNSHYGDGVMGKSYIDGHEPEGADLGLAKGVAAARLSELLGRKAKV
ncbi:hypothetical protein B0H34DRAFT_705183 [Crassisporium funariophilum]|nr:hypothetical protein B0H34DRAFT_705183 [Crassisporium funariophilum]